MVVTWFSMKTAVSSELNWLPAWFSRRRVNLWIVDRKPVTRLMLALQINVLQLQQMLVCLMKVFIKGKTVEEMNEWKTEILILIIDFCQSPFRRNIGTALTPAGPADSTAFILTENPFTSSAVSCILECALWLSGQSALQCIWSVWTCVTVGASHR